MKGPDVFVAQFRKKFCGNTFRFEDRRKYRGDRSGLQRDGIHRRADVEYVASTRSLHARAHVWVFGKLLAQRSQFLRHDGDGRINDDERSFQLFLQRGRAELVRADIDGHGPQLTASDDDRVTPRRGQPDR